MHIVKLVEKCFQETNIKVKGNHYNMVSDVIGFKITGTRQHYGSHLGNSSNGNKQSNRQEAASKWPCDLYYADFKSSHVHIGFEWFVLQIVKKFCAAAVLDDWANFHPTKQRFEPHNHL